MSLSYSHSGCSNNKSSKCRSQRNVLQLKIQDCKKLSKETPKYEKCAMRFKEMKKSYQLDCPVIKCKDYTKPASEVLKECENKDFKGSWCPNVVRQLAIYNYKLGAQGRIKCKNLNNEKKSLFAQDKLLKDFSKWTKCDWFYVEQIQLRKSELIDATANDELTNPEVFKLMVDLAFVYYSLGNVELAKILLINSIDVFLLDDNIDKAIKLLEEINKI